jgi:hypothetical protein
MNAHIVGFQEVFDKDALSAAAQASKLYGDKPEIIFEPNVDHLGQVHPSCAILTNLRVLESHAFVKFPKNSFVHYGKQKVVPIDEFS